MNNFLIGVKRIKDDDRTLAIYLLTHPNTENELIKKFKLK